jgi:hypothetical protein
MSKVRNAAEWRREVEGWRASGESMEAYARRRGYSKSSLGRWSSAYRPAPTDDAPRMVRLEVARAAAVSRASVVVQIGGARVVVEPGFDAELLREVVDALGREGGR